jgi:hypothetical protein
MKGKNRAAHRGLAPLPAAYDPPLEVHRGDTEVRDDQNGADILVDPEISARTAQSLGKDEPLASGRSCMCFTPDLTTCSPGSPIFSRPRSRPGREWRSRQLMIVFNRARQRFYPADIKL